MARVSLRTRLLLAVGLVAILALGAADIATYSALRSSLYNRVDDTLQTSQMAVMRALMGPPGSTVTVTPDLLEARAVGNFVQIRDQNGKPIVSHGAPTPNGKRYSPRLPATIPGLAALEAEAQQPPVKGDGGEGNLGSGGQNGPRAVYLTAPSRQKGGPSFRVSATVLPGGYQLLIASPLTETMNTLNRLVVIELAVTGAALVIAIALGWWLVRIGLRPLRDVETTAAAIADGELDQRVPGEDERTEVGRLARALNVMLGRIESAFAERDATEAELRESESELRASEARLRRFVADASHELRTPLAAVSAYAELLDGGEVKKEADLRRIMTGMRAETARMGTLVEDLLLLARLDEGRPLAKEPVELVGLLAETIQTSQTVGPDWPVRLDAGHPTEIIGDKDRLRQVFGNLLANVRAHTPTGTETMVRLGDLDGVAVVEIADNGPGLTEEQAARAFERFYRVDASRSRIHGGAGLGLSIVAAIVAAHGGSVSAASGPGGGATFTVRLPLEPDETEPSLDDELDAAEAELREGIAAAEPDSPDDAPEPDSPDAAPAATETP